MRHPVQGAFWLRYCSDRSLENLVVVLCLWVGESEKADKCHLSMDANEWMAIVDSTLLK